ncbi:porin [Pseudobdellovibrio exovorus]|uniref:Outer membrane protein n=1 Tax=Pseudobdellovibrio exovorus JSS TaxID=1184267 RepID=M4VP17_9BACT|nr:porin [Pseudobdellovibrio exovorus]AGH94874.1 hypothetical protein A11Q_654 [Pseudobdellovibrio exovorus JSS]
MGTQKLQKNKILSNLKNTKSGLMALLTGTALIIPNQGFSATDRKITWSGYVDTQYAFDFNSPANGDRAFTTQPARNNEFNINLGFIEVRSESTKTRGRFALQAGTAVQSNYSSEPTRGSISGGELSRHIQEARMGYAVGQNTWIDAGVFFAHVGSESWISKDNLTLTRSLVAEFSPYYLSGIKLTHAWSERLVLQLLLTNGWQNMSENNTDKSLGTGIEYSLDKVILVYNTILGNEISGDLNETPRNSELRHFHNFIVKSKSLERIEWVVQADVGFQRKPNSSSYSSWWGTTGMARYKLNETQKISGRIEHFEDPDQIVLVTGATEALNATGASIGFDQILDEDFLWRNEIRYLSATDSVFPEGTNSTSKENTTLTTSLAFSF